MGKLPKEKKKQTSIYLKPSIKQQLEKECERLDCSANYYINTLLRKKFEEVFGDVN